MKQASLMVTILVLLNLSQAFGATEVEIVNERTVDGEYQHYTVKALFQGDKSRYSFGEHVNTEIGIGGYLLSLDGGETIWHINTNKNTCYHSTNEELVQLLSGILLKTTNKFNVKIKDQAIQKVFEKDAGDINGLPAKHIRIHIGFNANYKYAFFSDEYKVERVVDTWVTPEFEEINSEPVFQRTWEYVGSEKLNQQLQMIIGTDAVYRLRTEIDQIMIDKKGKESTTKIVQYVKSITQIDDQGDEVFQLPDCTEVSADKVENNIKVALKKLFG